VADLERAWIALLTPNLIVGSPFWNGESNTLADTGRVTEFSQNASGGFMFVEEIRQTNEEKDDCFDFKVALKQNKLPFGDYSKDGCQ